MATTTSKPDLDASAPFVGAETPAWPAEKKNSNASDPADRGPAQDPEQYPPKPSQLDALQALLAFSALHQQLRRRKALASRHASFDTGGRIAESKPEFEADEQFVLDEVLQLVAQRAVAITGADGLAIALAENDQVVLRAAAGTVRPDVGARIDRESAFSGACFRTAEIVNCDDTETDPRVNLEACRKLGARSMVAVPLCGRRRVIGLLEAFSAWPFGFNESDIRNLSLLAELILGALKPEDEDRFAESAQAAVTKLEPSATSLEAARLQTGQAAAIPPLGALVDKKPGDEKLITHQVTDYKVKQSLEDNTSALKPDGSKVLITPSKAENKAQETFTAEIPVKAASAKSKQVIQKAPEVVAEAAVERAAFAQVQTSKSRPFALISLVAIVIIAAFAGGVWWKLKSSQLGSAMVDSETPQKVAAENTAPSERVPQAPVPAAPSSNANSAMNANATPDATSDSDETANSPASTQELSKFPRVTAVRHWASADSSTVVLDLEDQVQYEAHRLAGPDRIYFDLRDTQLASDLVGKVIDVGDTFVSRVRMAQPVAGMTRVVLETKANSTFSVSLEPNPYRLVVEVRKIGANPKTVVDLFPNAPNAEKNKLAIVVPPPTKEDLQLRARVPKMRIVVDAGHGGWDLGTVGRRGLLEKDVVLEIAQRLGKLLESRLGMEVIYTRQDDNYIPLDERAEIANQAQADLFVSVHANYSDLPSARGVETYYTNFFSAPGTKDLDTHVTIGGGKNPVTTSLSAADLHERIEQSRRLAASVQHSLYGTLSLQNPGLRDRGVKEAGFVVLTESAMPGILAEVSFVSSPTDEQKLRSDGYREQIAEALYKGIARYAASSRAVKVAAK